MPTSPFLAFPRFPASRFSSAIVLRSSFSASGRKNLLSRVCPLVNALLAGNAERKRFQFHWQVVRCKCSDRERENADTKNRLCARAQASEFYHPSCGCQIIPSELKRGIAEALGLETLCENRERDERDARRSRCLDFPSEIQKESSRQIRENLRVLPLTFLGQGKQ